MNNVTHAETRFKDRQSLTHRALVNIGRVGTEDRKGRAVSDAEAAHYGKRRLVLGAVAGFLLPAMALFGKKTYEDQTNAVPFQERVAACATKFEGHNVEIKVDGDGNPIIPVGVDSKVIAACEDANGNFEEAQKWLHGAKGPVPLDPNIDATNPYVDK